MSRSGATGFLTTRAAPTDPLEASPASRGFLPLDDLARGPNSVQAGSAPAHRTSCTDKDLRASASAVNGLGVRLFDSVTGQHAGHA